MKKRRLHLYTAAMLFACTYSLHGQTTYTDGVFMLNEDLYGHYNSTLNFIRPDHPTDPFEYYIIQNNESNAGQSLGATAQFGAVYGDYLFIISGDEDNADGVGPLYQNQIGMMLRTADYVFAIQQDKGVLVIDPQTDKIIHTVEGCFSP